VPVGPRVSPRSGPHPAYDARDADGARVTAIACGHEDAIDHNDLRHDPLTKVAVGRCPESGAPLGSQSTISRLENAPSKTDAARLTVALVDQFATTVTPGRMEMFDIDDTFCVAHGGQQLAFWNAHHDERGFAPMHIYHAGSGAPVVAILRPARTPKGTEVRTVIKHVTKHLRRHWRPPASCGAAMAITAASRRWTGRTSTTTSITYSARR
jgi:Transposase DDE domain group 1